jgi:hypothetical protein
MAYSQEETTRETNQYLSFGQTVRAAPGTGRSGGGCCGGTDTPCRRYLPRMGRSHLSPRCPSPEKRKSHFLPRLKRRGLIRALRCKLAESSDKSERGEPVCPKFHPNVSWLKVRTRFPPSDSLEKRRVLFKRKEARQIYISCLSRVGFGCSMSSIVSALSEDSAQNPIIGPNLSEDSPNLPPQLSGRPLVNSANVRRFLR